jgi:hypothetical protein
MRPQVDMTDFMTNAGTGVWLNVRAWARLYGCEYESMRVRLCRYVSRGYMTKRPAKTGMEYMITIEARDKILERPLNRRGVKLGKLAKPASRDGKANELFYLFMGA